MYAASTTSTTTSSRLGAAGGERERRVRAVRLVRPRRSAPAFGFSLRGGREHATGFFISKVDFNSEAHNQGLKVGDQVVSVNGYRVDDAVHAELAHYVAAQSRLNIKVRNVGMIPVKEAPRVDPLNFFPSKAHEPLSWQCVSERASLGSGTSASPTLCETERLALRLSILVPPRAKLGCGICKGPEWKPGIFVQFVREGGIAREAGLRPGDQILSCNGQDFASITFNEAIAAMKASGRLELQVREGAGLELVSPESSGYNSSASSAAGERSPAPPAPLAPPAALRRRLASVAEEAADRADRLNIHRLKRRTWDSIDFDWKTPEDIHNFDAPSDIEPDYDSPSIPNNPHTYENQKKKLHKKEFVTSPSNRTIINLTEDGAMIQCSYDNPRKTTFSNLANKDSDKKTIVVEVHHMNNTQCASAKCKPPPPMKELASDSSSLASSTTLSNAIAEEIERRKMLKKSASQEPKQAVKHEAARKSSAPKPPENVMKKQHDALMDEFKKVHRKMFANQDANEGAKNGAPAEDSTSVDRQQTLPLRKVENGTTDAVTNGYHATRDVPDGPLTSRDRQETLPLRKAENGDVIANGHHPKREATEDPPAPPPPPMPATNGLQNGKIKKAISQIQMINNSDQTNGSSLKNGTSHRNGSLSRTPTPDYNALAEPLARVKTNKRDERAELESLESYTLKNPSAVQPRPPSTYFMKAPNGTATMKKHVRPVSVTIGEYASGGGVRRQPSKLEFLNGDKADGSPPTDDLSNRLQSELALTLSRSNLRKNTETLNHKQTKDDSEEIDMASLDRNFHARYGNNILPLPPSISIPKVSGVKPPASATSKQ